MRKGLTIGALAGALGLVATTWLVTVDAQTPRAAPTAATAQAKPFTTPRTSWGDPDISGTWSSDDLRSVPIQRPAEFGGRGAALRRGVRQARGG